MHTIGAIVATSVLLTGAVNIPSEVEYYETEQEIISQKVLVLTQEDWIKREIEKYDWDVSIAYSIMMAESGGNPDAINWSDSHKTCPGSFGLMQIACHHFDEGEDRLDPVLNIQKAYELYLTERSWGHWAVCLSKNKEPIVICS